MIQLLLPFAKNIKGGPKTTIVGGLLFAFAGYMVYTSDKTLLTQLNEDSLLTLVLSLGFICIFLKDYKKPKLPADSREDEDIL